MTAASVGAGERKDVPDKYKWNLADLYPSEAAWTKAKDAVAKRVPELAKRKGGCKSPKDLLAVLHDDVRDRSRAVAAARCTRIRLSDEDVRAARPREMKQAAEELATAFSAATLLGASRDPGARPRQGAPLDHAGSEARPLSHVPGRDAAPQAAHAGRPRGEDCRRGGRDGAGRRRGARRALQRRPPVSDHQAVDGRVRAPGRVRVHAAPPGARARRSRQGVRVVLRRAEDVRAHHGRDAVRGGEGAPVREAGAALRHRAGGGAVPGQHPAGRLQAAARRRAPEPADAASLPGAAQADARPGDPALPGPVRAAGRERRHALRARRGAGDHAGRAGAARARRTGRR